MLAGAMDFVRSALDFPKRQRQVQIWEKIQRSDSQEPVVAFGGLLEEGRFIHGGAVKLLSLRDGFACDERTFNMLYLVSSSLPTFAESLASICQKKGIRFVWNQNGVGYPAWAGINAERLNRPMRRLRASADHVIYQSNFCKLSAEKFLGPCDKPSAVLLNPVNLQKFCPRDEPTPEQPLRLLAMGTQNYRERVMSVLECVKALRARSVECSLTLAGPLIWKNAMTETHEVIKSLGLTNSVSLRPPFSRDEAPDIYRDHHILIHPKYLDPCPTVVAEALACGLPVVASRSGGLPEMTNDTCAELVDVPWTWDRLITPSGEDFANAVQRLLGRLSTASAAARKCAEEKFDQDKWVALHREIFTEVLAH